MKSKVELGFSVWFMDNAEKNSNALCNSTKMIHQNALISAILFFNVKLLSILLNSCIFAQQLLSNELLKIMDFFKQMEGDR